MTQSDSRHLQDETVAARRADQAATVTDREEKDPYRPDTPLEMQGPGHDRRLDRSDVKSFGVDRDDAFDPAVARQDDLQPADTSRNVSPDTLQMRPAIDSNPARLSKDGETRATEAHEDPSHLNSSAS